MIISCASGKGGTGKTTIATSLALSLGAPVQFFDCDVEEPNAHIFLKPVITKTEPVSIPIPDIDDEKCDYCGECARICVYHALAVLKDSVLTFPHLCHGCGGCSLLCPQKAITEVGKEIGVIEKGSAGDIDFVHGKLNVGEILSPPLIRAVKKYVDLNKIVIIDAPPGTSCPVIAAIKDSDYCILVTEPTPFGLYDLTLAVEVVRKLDIACGVIINRANLGDSSVTEYCDREHIPILMSIPFDRDIAVAYSRGISIIAQQREFRRQFQRLYETIKDEIS
ncbi:ATP-binding protein [candidate division WOR-3 bacterium]|nr:ATP-binding protein [candidate division WOR-3 bacterium]